MSLIAKERAKLGDKHFVANIVKVIALHEKMQWSPIAGLLARWMPWLLKEQLLVCQRRAEGR